MAKHSQLVEKPTFLLLTSILSHNYVNNGFIYVTHVTLTSDVTDLRFDVIKSCITVSWQPEQHLIYIFTSWFASHITGVRLNVRYGNVLTSRTIHNEVSSWQIVCGATCCYKGGRKSHHSNNWQYLLHEYAVGYSAPNYVYKCYYIYSTTRIIYWTSLMIHSLLKYKPTWSRFRHWQELNG